MFIFVNNDERLLVGVNTAPNAPYREASQHSKRFGRGLDKSPFRKKH
jgi:hypothetical protein